MNGWDQLSRLHAKLRPIDAWPGVLKTTRYRSNFDTPIGTTMKLLARELDMLGAKDIVLQAAFRERDIRIDGLPRSNASPEHPGLILSFESRHGPLQYSTDEYRSWEENLRAIALSLESLRRVDRYGVSKRGEQYRGWLAIEQTSSDPAASIRNADDARDVLARYSSSTDVDTAIRIAIKATHPDAGGDADAFRQVIRAKEILAA